MSDLVFLGSDAGAARCLRELASRFEVGLVAFLIYKGVLAARERKAERVRGLRALGFEPREAPAELTFSDDPALPVFPLNPLLYDLPIPVRCQGPVQEPLCRLDADAAQRLVAQALSGGEDNALRARLERRA